MKLQFIGVGTAFDVVNFNSNMLLGDTGNKLAIDFGSFAPIALHELKINIDEVQSVYLSHLHADHAGGMEFLGFKKYFVPKPAAPNLYISQNLEDSLWQMLAPGMRSLQMKIANLRTYFNVFSLKDNENFDFFSGGEHAIVSPIQTVHVVNNAVFVHSYGLIIEINGHKTFITTDTQFAPNQLKDFYKSVDLIFHDCEMLPGFKSGVHAHFDELSTLPDDIKKKMWLYHYQTAFLDKFDVLGNGFAGLVQKGQTFDI